MSSPKTETTANNNVEVIIYGKNNCPYCDHAKNFFNDQHIPYTYYNTSEDEDKLNEMLSKTKGRTFPQIFINGHEIGGFSNLKTLYEDNNEKYQEIINWWS